MASIFDTIVGVAGETRYDAALDTTYRYNSRTAAWEVDGTGTPSSAGFPTTGLKVGDIREDIDTGRSYRWNGTTWVLISVSTGGGSTEIADGSITTDKLADGAVTNIKLGDGSVSSAKAGVGVVIDNVVIDGLSWMTTVPDTVNTTYQFNQVTFTTSGLSGLGEIYVSSIMGGTTDNISFNGMVVTFDYTSPDNTDDILVFSGTSGSGVPFNIEYMFPLSI